MAYSYNPAPMSQWDVNKKSYEDASDPTAIKALDRGRDQKQLDFTNKLATDKAQRDKETLADARVKSKTAMLKFLTPEKRAEMLSSIWNEDLAGGGDFQFDKNNPQAVSALASSTAKIFEGRNGQIDTAALEASIEMLNTDNMGSDENPVGQVFDSAESSAASQGFQPGGGQPQSGGLGQWTGSDMMPTAEDLAQGKAQRALPGELMKAYGTLDYSNPAVRAGIHDQVGLADSMTTVARLYEEEYAGHVSGIKKKLDVLLSEVGDEFERFNWWGSGKSQQAEQYANIHGMLQKFNAENPGPYPEGSKEDIKFRTWQNAVQNMVMLAVTKRGGKALTATEIALISSSYGQDQGPHFMKAALMKWQADNYRDLRTNYLGATRISEESGYFQNVLHQFTPESMQVTPEVYGSLFSVPLSADQAKELQTQYNIQGAGTADVMQPQGSTPRQEMLANQDARIEKRSDKKIIAGMLPKAQAEYHAATPVQQKAILDFVRNQGNR